MTAVTIHLNPRIIPMSMAAWSTVVFPTPDSPTIVIPLTVVFSVFTYLYIWHEIISNKSVCSLKDSIACSSDSNSFGFHKILCSRLTPGRRMSSNVGAFSKILFLFKLESVTFAKVLSMLSVGESPYPKGNIKFTDGE